jgi:antitoxin (DNA-binding transcriptional repressor) of toxin-antitoxin stability system
MEEMAIIHISEVEAVRDFATLLDHVRAGSEVIIDGDSAPVAVLGPPAEQTAAPEPGHDEWFWSQVQQALDDRRPGTPAEEVEARFAQRRADSLSRRSDIAG